MSTIGIRLKRERERLGLTQPAFAEAAGAKKRTLIDWEKDVSSPTAVQLAALAQAGVSVTYVLLGIESDSSSRLDAAEALLVDSYKRCGMQARQTLIHTASLLAAGSSEDLPVPKPVTKVIKQIAASRSVQIGGDATGSNISTGESVGNARTTRSRKP